MAPVLLYVDLYNLFGGILFSDIFKHVSQLITAGELDKASLYLLKQAAILSDESPKEADQLAVFSERLIAEGRKNRKIISSIKNNEFSEKRLDKDFQAYKGKLEIPLGYIYDMEDLGEPVLYRGGVLRHPLGPDHFFEIKKDIESPNFNDCILRDDFLDMLEGQVGYYDYMTPFGCRSYLNIGRRKGVVRQGRYYAYLALKKKKPSIDKAVADLRNQAKSILNGLEKIYENKELSVQYFWVESELVQEIKLLEKRLMNAE